MRRTSACGSPYGNSDLGGLATAGILQDFRTDPIHTHSIRLYTLEDLAELLGVPADPPAGEIGESSLSETEQRALADSFIRDPSGDESVPILMSLLTGFEDVNFDRALVSVIEEAFAAPQIPGWTPDAIRYLIIRRGFRDWGAEIWRQDLESGDLKQRWPLLVKDLHL